MSLPQSLARRGLLARLHYLTRTDHARQAARAAGLTVTDRTVKAWMEGKRRPSRANLERIETAYRTVRRHNVARHLLRRLNSGGGTRVELHPLNQSQVPRPQQRFVEYRALNVRRWDRIVAACVKCRCNATKVMPLLSQCQKSDKGALACG